MVRFIGRDRELSALREQFDRVVDQTPAGRPGRAVLIRGRRRVGKSRLVEEFIEQCVAPSVYFTAVGGSREADLAAFVRDVAASDLPEAAVVGELSTPLSWDAALQALVTVLPTDTPSIVVMDEVPYVVRQDPSFEGVLQRTFDRALIHRPVLLILVGSDMAMMEQLDAYGRPFHQRGTELVVPSLSPKDVAGLTGLEGAEALDAFLVSGGLPLVLQEWRSGDSVWDFLEASLTSTTSALIVSGERALAAEFPVEAQARTVLAEIGHGERTFTAIGRAAGGLHPTSLKRSLDLLIHRRAVAAERPLSTKVGRETRYHVADPYLRFWLSFVASNLPRLERGRADLALETIRTSWPSWRGRAIEPVIRESLLRLRGEPLIDSSGTVGGFWTRTNDPEIDLVGADRGPTARRITFVGSITWHESAPFSDRDLARLLVHRTQLPGAVDTTPLVAVSRTGGTAQGVRMITPEELLDAW